VTKALPDLWRTLAREQRVFLRQQIASRNADVFLPRLHEGTVQSVAPQPCCLRRFGADQGVCPQDEPDGKEAVIFQLEAANLKEKSMMNYLTKPVLAFLCALTFSAPALAADRGTREEAVAMVKKAAAYLKDNGREKAFAEFNKQPGSFRDRDLYVFVMEMNGLEVMNGNNPKLVGKNLLELKDANGKMMVKEFIDVAKNKGSGWVDYAWPSPVKGEIEHKSTYVEKVGDVLIGCGVYK
jgi:cytochrome c